MAEDRLILAIGRLEQSLGRLERAAAAQPAPSGDPALAGRHAELRRTVEQTIVALDGLIAHG